MSDASKAVFLSYASQDAEAAKHICEALRQAGVEVWFDQSELVGGDAWDQKIRRQIKDCALLIPIISAATQSRTEGYFRLEWRLADQRTHLMAKGRPFLLPVVIDDTRDADAQVPDSFLEVQWTRLRGGETSPAFAQRVKKLLSGEQGAGSTEHSVGPSLDDARSEANVGRRPTSGAGAMEARAAPLRDKNPRWLRPVLASGAIVIAVLAITLINRRDPGPPAPRPAATPTGAALAASTPWSEARKLVERARPLLFEHNARRADFDAAAPLLEQAAKLDPNDATVWAVMAVLDCRYIDENYDRSETRRASATHHADRALALDASSRDARFARAVALIRASHYSPDASAEGAGVFRALLAENPGDKNVLTALAFAQGGAGQMDEALHLFDQLAGFPGEAGHAAYCRAWVLFRSARYREALKEVTNAVKLEPTAPAQLLKGEIEMTWLGDLDLARNSLAALPASALLEDGPATFAWWLHYWRREYDLALGDLARVPREFVDSKMGTLAKATLAATTLRAAGRVEGTRAQAGIALELVERRLVAERDNRSLLYEKIMVLGLLGRRDEAGVQLKLFRELVGGWYPDPDLFLEIGDPEAALREMDAIVANPRSWTAAALRLEPLYDALRSDPRFQAILAQAERDPRMSPTASASGPAPAPLPSDKSVAVLAFANLSDDKNNEYFSDGISEELLNVLCKVPGLKVTARTSSFSFKGRDVPVPEIAQKLGVAYVVEGSVRKSGDKVRITAQLIKAADGFHVWSDTFTRDLKDIFAVQDEIAGLIARNLELKMASPARATAIAPEAYELYLEGMAASRLRTPEGLARAEELLGRVIEQAPGFAPAKATLSVVLGVLNLPTHALGTLNSRDSAVARRSLALAEEAVRLDPDSAETLAALGSAYLTQLRFEDAERVLRRAVAANPNYAHAHQWLGRTVLVLGRMDEALDELKKATELDPLSHRILDNYGLGLMDAGRAREAIEASDRALRLQPDSAQALAVKVCALAMANRVAEALALANTDSAFREGDLSYVISAYARAGHRAEIEALLPGIPPRNPIDRLAALAALGRHREALAALDPRSFSWGDLDTLLFEPLFDPLRADARFQEVLRELGMTEAHARAQAWRAAHRPEKLEAKK